MKLGIKLILLMAIVLFSACNTTKNNSNVVKGKHPKKQTNLATNQVQQKDGTRINQLENQTISVPIIKDTRYYYERAYQALKEMLEHPENLNFKKAVFITENAFYDEKLDYELFDKQILKYSTMCKLKYSQLRSNEYKYSDSILFKKNWAIYSIMTDTFQFKDLAPIHYGFHYNFEDYAGKRDWSNHFVSKLLEAGKGNCHSLPYFYKILADEMQTDAYLAIAPNHIYIKHRNKKFAWYNTELTSGEFPSDAWVKCSGYITIDAIRSGIYMDTLSYAQSVALCAYDLAKSFNNKMQKYGDDFTIKCCDLVLKYYENCINAMLLKAETIKAKYDWARKQNETEKARYYLETMEPIYYKCLKLGYREMPEEVYQVWLQSINEQKEKFENQKIKSIFDNK